MPELRIDSISEGLDPGCYNLFLSVTYIWWVPDDGNRSQGDAQREQALRHRLCVRKPPFFLKIITVFVFFDYGIPIKRFRHHTDNTKSFAKYQYMVN
jgi:hypothetical protein